MSAGDVLLKIVEEDNHGITQYKVHYRGHEFGLMSPIEPAVQFNSYGMIGHGRTEVAFDFRAVLLEPEPEPAKPKRSVARTLGLRRPR